MNIPASTYRIQFHKDFIFGDLTVILEYLHNLGIDTIYAAPILQATPGSMHGYDVIDPHCINPEIGTVEELQELAKTLKQYNMKWIQDIVPNHMAFNVLNARLMDVLERGPASPYYNYFDIDWSHPDPDLNGKLMVPFLGEELDTLLEKGDVKLVWGGQGLMIGYFETYYPVSISAYEYIFREGRADHLNWEVFIAEARKVGDLKSYRKSKEKFIDTVIETPGALQAMEVLVSRINQNKTLLKKILDSQFYQLTYWKQTETRINYRRFFTVNELICLRMEEQAVFNEYHQFLHELYQQNLIQGVRIDHIDGLQDPAGYIRRLRGLFGDDCYIIAEKILEASEVIPTEWPLQGTSGYEFLSYVSQLMTNRKGAKQLLAFYKDLVPDIPGYKELVQRNKHLILERYMAGEWENLTSYFDSLGLMNGQKRARLKLSLGTLMMAMPVYRIYPEHVPLTGHSLNVMKESAERATSMRPDLKSEIEYLFKLFAGKESADKIAVLKFLRRMMQFTGPLTAKGVEDTTFYVYNPLLSHDEVGDAPSTLGISINNFHAKMSERQLNTPLSLNATATHDTKRGEDARLRLNVLTEQPDIWMANVRMWFEINRDFHYRTSRGVIAPSVNDEYYLYQAITGGFPEDEIVTEAWIQRLLAYQLKALREAKVYSDWAEPDAEYENGCAQFVRAILKPGSLFMESFVSFIKRVVEEANRNALNQVLIKMTTPGIPDVYQGCELWDLSFVDPDNRRPVDYLKRMALLELIRQKETEGTPVLFSFLDDQKLEGAQKLFLCSKVLNFRRDHQQLFSEGKYIPLQLNYKNSAVIAYARNYNDQWALMIAPLQDFPKGEIGTDELVLPEGSPGRWRNVINGELMEGNGRLSITEILKSFSVGLLVSEG